MTNDASMILFGLRSNWYLPATAVVCACLATSVTVLGWRAARMEPRRWKSAIWAIAGATGVLACTTSLVAAARIRTDLDIAAGATRTMLEATSAQTQLSLLTRLQAIQHDLASPPPARHVGLVPVEVSESATVTGGQEVQGTTTITARVASLPHAQPHMLYFEYGRIRHDTISPASADAATLTHVNIFRNGRLINVPSLAANGSSKSHSYFVETERLMNRDAGGTYAKACVSVFLTSEQLSSLGISADDEIAVAISYAISGWSPTNPVTFFYAAPQQFGVDTLRAYESRIEFSRGLAGSAVQYLSPIPGASALGSIMDTPPAGVAVSVESSGRELVVSALNGLDSPFVLFFRQQITLSEEECANLAALVRSGGLASR